MKKDFLIILALLIFAVMGIYVSCTGTETEKCQTYTLTEKADPDKISSW